MISEKLLNKTARERADVKSAEIAKLDHVARWTDSRHGVEVQITSLEAIPGGVQVTARAWRAGKPVGFGRDGSVEIERFRIFNPPVLVDDPSGPIERSWEEEDGTKKTRRHREDPVQAIREVIAHNVVLVGKSGDRITPGKVGTTTSTYFPDAGNGNTTCDNSPINTGSSSSFSTIRNGAGTGLGGSGVNLNLGDIEMTTTTDQFDQIVRSIMTFDTSSIADTDSIDSGTLSLAGNGSDPNNTLSPAQAIAIGGATPAANNNIVAADYAQVGSTRYADADITTVAWDPVDGHYNTWTLNAAGLAAISVTGISKFCTRMKADMDNAAPTWASNGRENVIARSADQTGTTSDPKLVIVHTAVVRTDEAHAGPRITAPVVFNRRPDVAAI